MLKNGGGGTFDPYCRFDSGAVAPRSPLRADIDGDLDLDRVAGNGASRCVSVPANTRNATFGPPSTYGIGVPASAIVAGDLDNDGGPDVAVADGVQGYFSVLRSVCR